MMFRSPAAAVYTSVSPSNATLAASAGAVMARASAVASPAVHPYLMGDSVSCALRDPTQISKHRTMDHQRYRHPAREPMSARGPAPD